jgi:molybdopterin synthase sulfur carrier subunit
VIRVQLPFHLRKLAHIDGELHLEVPPPVTVASTITAIENRYPMLRGTIREHDTHKRRPFIRFFACKEDLSLESPDTPLPEPILDGSEPFLIIGAMAGG